MCIAFQPLFLNETIYKNSNETLQNMAANI